MKIGDKAPDFNLQDTDGNYQQLSDLTNTGKQLLLFFPLAFSSVCTEEMCIVRDNLKLYNSLNVNVLGISVDSFFTLREFKKKNNLPFILLSDFNRKASESFGVLNQDFYGLRGVSYRSAFIISEDMTIKYAEVLEDAGNHPDFDAIASSL